MLIYKDFKSGDEFFTDVFRFKEVDDLYYELEGKLMTISDDLDESKFGANKSAEDEGGDETQASGKTGVDIVLQNRLIETQFNKKSYKAYIKEFVGCLLKHLEETKPDMDLTAYKKKLNTFIAKKILAEFDEFQFFVGDTQDNDGLVGYMYWKGETPYMMFLKHALIEEKQ